MHFQQVHQRPSANQHRAVLLLVMLAQFRSEQLRRRTADDIGLARATATLHQGFVHFQVAPAVVLDEVDDVRQVIEQRAGCERIAQTA